MKKCKKCGIEKDESEFFKKKGKWFEGTCKACKKQKVLDKIAQDPNKHREKERLRSENRRKTKEWKEWRKDYQARNRKEISEKSLEYYHSSISVREKHKEWIRKNRKKVTECIKQHHEKNPLKVLCRSFVRSAIKKGILTRADKCSECLKECKPEAHHEDYMKPLDIIWLCRRCHGAKHRKNYVSGCTS